MSKKLQLKQLCETLSIAEITVKKWRAEGLPGDILNRRLLFDPKRVYSWLLAKGKIELAAKLEGIYPGIATASRKGSLLVASSEKSASATKPRSVADLEKKRDATKPQGVIPFKPRKPRLEAAPPPLPPSDEPFSLPSLSSIDAANIFETRRFIGRLLKRVEALADKGSDAMLAVLFKEAVGLGELLRKLEISCIAVDREFGNVMEVSEAQRIVGQLLTQVKTSLRSIPAKVADRLAAEADPKKVNALLALEIDDSLRNLSETVVRPNSKGEESAAL